MFHTRSTPGQENETCCRNRERRTEANKAVRSLGQGGTGREGKGSVEQGKRRKECQNRKPESHFP